MFFFFKYNFFSPVSGEGVPALARQNNWSGQQRKVSKICLSVVKTAGTIGRYCLQRQWQLKKFSSCKLAEVWILQ